MFEVIMYFNEINKNFYFADFGDILFDGYVQLFPKNMEIIDYWKYFKRYGTLSGFSPNGKPDIFYYKYHAFLSKIHTFENIPKYKIVGIEDDDDNYLKFQFSDEETAFYFKLKFC